MAAIYLTEAEVDRLLNMKLAIEVCEEAFRRLAAGEADNIPRVRAQSPGIILHSMSAAAAYLGLVGWKCYTTTRKGAKFHVGLYDLSGSLVALIEGDRLGQLRTGATTGVAVEAMADPGATEMGLFGAGWQAQSQLAAVATARPIKVAYVYSRNEKKRNDFAESMSAQLGIEVRPVDRPQEAAEDLPIVVTATTSREPVFDGSWLAEGALVSAVGSNWLTKAEIDSNVVRRADNIVCDSIKACQIEAGDFVEAIEKGIFDWSRAVELSDVVTGKATGRNTRESIALFKSVGMALEDVALGGKVLELARKQKIGRELPF
ncbi:MAG: ornithine cyclodeaminase family protein [Planctomycetia bacterium]|nr:ornithine cyclodeaminase family protein [Planctomycetia bacterium]